MSMLVVFWIVTLILIFLNNVTGTEMERIELVVISLLVTIAYGLDTLRRDYFRRMRDE